MKKILGILVLAGLSFTSSAAQAADQSNGCGLGWEVAPKPSLISSSTRQTTNAFLPNTFSMTSGTSGCAKHAIVKNDEKAVHYAANNFESLQAEMARGRGEFLETFAQTLGCDALGSAELGALTQRQYGEIMKSAQGNGIGLYQAVRARMERAPALAGRCVPSA